MSIIDQYGIPRHTLTHAQLEALYKAFENFIGDSTVEEYFKNKEAFNIVKTAIHQRMRKIDKEK